MHPIRGNRSLVFGLIAATVAALSIVAYADNGSPSPTAGVKQPASPVSVGGLAKLLVTEVALNSPTGGYSESSALGIMRAVGYDPKRGTDGTATVADLKAMLSALGVESATKNPQENLTVVRVTETLAALRSTLPRFTVPVSDRAGTAAIDNPDSQPGPCRIALLACRSRCNDQSPSGTGETNAGCLQDCNNAFQECRRRLFGSSPGKH